jgi:hypothetical protein
MAKALLRASDMFWAARREKTGEQAARRQKAKGKRVEVTDAGGGGTGKELSLPAFKSPVLLQDIKDNTAEFSNSLVGPVAHYSFSL